MTQGLRYNVDIVFCIDVTGSMHGILETVKTNALRFYPDLQKALSEKDKNVDSLRIRVIAFRDFEADGSSALEQLDFVKIPEDESKFGTFINGLRPDGGGDEPENGLEAVALAIKSDWDNGGDRQRHIIVVWSDASTHPLDKPSSCKPSGMPANFNELTDWWEGQSYMSRTAKRLILFTPDSSAWTDIATHWESVIHVPSRAGEGLADVDYKTILSTIVNSI
ncbi:MAG: VWA domain-containing protein [Rickettsiales bacterium]|jgi:hypothetical protein|nr:VWA domain-containing protein [Rickettsiales bacterium]